MATQTLEFSAGTGLTLSCKLFALGSDTVVATALATEKTNDKNRYTVQFASLNGAYRLNAFVSAVGGFANEVYDVTDIAATFTPRSEAKIDTSLLALETTSQSIKAKTDLISATGAVVTNSPVTATGSVRPIVIGDDYLAANGRAFSWTIAAISGITPGTATAYFGGTSTGTPTDEFKVSGTVSDNGNGTWTIRCDMTAAVSATLLEQQYEWTLGIQAAGGTRVTPVRWGERLQCVTSHTWS